MNFKAIMSAIKLYGPRVVGYLMAGMQVYQDGMTWQAFAKAALWAILGHVVKPVNMTGGTVPNPTSAINTLPMSPLTVNTGLVDPAKPDVALPK